MLLFDDSDVTIVKISEAKAVMVLLLECPGCGYSFCVDLLLDREVIECPECVELFRVS